MIDLHIHSTASDGSLSPSRILQKAIKSGLTAIAITDHDTTEGVREAIESGIPHPLEFVTGVEISALPPDEYINTGTLHILGYGFSIYDRQMIETLQKLKQARSRRNPQIIEKLNQLGFHLSIEEVEQICGPGQMGRPHIARAMVEKGYVSSFDEAFDLYLSNDKPAYVDKFRLSSKEAIELILEAGGLPVLAHPGIIDFAEDPLLNSTVVSGEQAHLENPGEFNNQAGKSTFSLENLISRLTAMGLAGIEVYHTDHSRDQTLFFKKIALRKGLLTTGGSDFHGRLKPEVDLGGNNLDIDHELYRNLCFAIEKNRQKRPAVEKLEANLCHSFKNRSLLYNALYHSSYVNEVQRADITDNQRLEFLGDAVLGLAVGHILMDKFPNMKEGELSKLRASLVSEVGLSAMARIMDLGRFICLGKGERLSRGAEKNSILADTFEAIIAAIYLELGFEETFQLIARHFEPLIARMNLNSETEDYKSMLQELVQEMGDFTPCYTISKESGPDHDKTFEVTLKVCSVKAQGEGKSKKAAEQNAAANALAILKNSKKQDTVHSL